MCTSPTFLVTLEHSLRAHRPPYMVSQATAAASAAGLAALSAPEEHHLKQDRLCSAMLCSSLLHCCMQCCIARTCCRQCTAGSQLNTALQSTVASAGSALLSLDMHLESPLLCGMQPSAGFCWTSSFSCAEHCRATYRCCCAKPLMQQPHALPLLAALHCNSAAGSLQELRPGTTALQLLRLVEQGYMALSYRPKFSFIVRRTSSKTQLG